MSTLYYNLQFIVMILAQNIFVLSVELLREFCQQQIYRVTSTQQSCGAMLAKADLFTRSPVMNNRDL